LPPELINVWLPYVENHAAQRNDDPARLLAASPTGGDLQSVGPVAGFVIGPKGRWHQLALSAHDKPLHAAYFIGCQRLVQLESREMRIAVALGEQFVLSGDRPPARIIDRQAALRTRPVAPRLGLAGHFSTRQRDDVAADRLVSQQRASRERVTMLRNKWRIVRFNLTNAGIMRGGDDSDWNICKQLPNYT
jgi:hypothetical protein